MAAGSQPLNHANTTLVGSIVAPLRSLAPTLDAIDQFVRSDSELIQVQPM